MRRQKVEKEAVGGRGRCMSQQKGEAVGDNRHEVKTVSKAGSKRRRI